LRSEAVSSPRLSAIDNSSDGVLGIFDRLLDAVLAAVEAQREMRTAE